MLKQTPLNAAHRQLGARMVDFGGWEMPVNYGSQLDEHHAVRTDCGMFDVSHMLPIDIRGSGARDFLRWALANNVDKLTTPGKALYTCMLNPDGGIVDDLIVTRLREDLFRIVVNAGTAEKDQAWLGALLKEAAGCSAEIDARRELAIVAVQGPNARAKVWDVLPDAKAVTEALKPFSAAIHDDRRLGSMMISRTGYTGEDGFEILIDEAHVPKLWQRLIGAGVRPCGLGARDTLRLEAGLNLYGQDMDESTSPLESGLAWTVDMTAPREFVGKTALAAHEPTQQFSGLLLIDKGGILRSHQRVHAPAGDGEITSGTFSPTLKCSIAMARVPAAVAIDDRVEVEVRDKRLPACVVKLPFVRHGKALVQV